MNQLTLKQYVKNGYVHNFVDENGNAKTIETNEADFNNSTIPELEGFTYLNSQGEIIIVDSPNVVLQENEYTIINNTYYVCTKNEYGLKVTEYSEEEFNNIWQ